jgi:lipopolysaccharide heptosyltransferase II
VSDPLLESPAPRILVVPLRYIGDTILTVPLLRNLRQAFPQSHIDLLTSRVAASLMEPCPDVNRVLIEPKAFQERLALLRAGRYDRIFILRKSVTLAGMAKLAGIPERIGYDKQRFPFGYRRWGWFLTQKAAYPGLRTRIHQAVSHLSLLRAADIPAQDDHLALWTTSEDERAVTELLVAYGIALDRPLAALHAASASHGKQIAFDTFAQAVQTLIDQGYQMVATGTPPDVPLYEALKQQHGLQLINLAGETTLRQTVALYKRLQLLLTVDSSPIHIASAVGVPRVVGVFGPTNERQWGTHNPDTRFYPVFLDLPCRPCYPKVCAHNSCKVLITSQQITDAVKQALADA